MSFSLGDLLKNKAIDTPIFDERPVACDTMEQPIPNYSSMENVSNDETAASTGCSMPNYSINHASSGLSHMSLHGVLTDGPSSYGISTLVDKTEEEQEPEMRSHVRMLSDTCNVIDLFGSAPSASKEGNLEHLVAVLEQDNIAFKHELALLEKSNLNLQHLNQSLEDELDEVRKKLQESLYREKMAVHFPANAGDSTDASASALEGVVHQLSESRERALIAEQANDRLISQVDQLGEEREKFQLAELGLQKANYQAEEWREKAARIEAQSRVELQMAKSNAKYVMDDCTNKTRILESQMGDCNLRLSQALDKLKSQERNRMDADAEIFSLKCRLQDAQSNVDRESVECNNMRRLLGESQNALDRETSQLRGKVTAVEMELSSMNKRNRQLVSQLNSLSGDNNQTMEPAEYRSSSIPPTSSYSYEFAPPTTTASNDNGTGSSLAAYTNGNNWSSDTMITSPADPTKSNTFDRQTKRSSTASIDASSYDQFYADNKREKKSDLGSGNGDFVPGSDRSRSLASLLGKFSDDVSPAAGTTIGTNVNPPRAPSAAIGIARDSVFPSAPPLGPASSEEKSKDNNEYNFNEQFPSRKPMSSNSPFATDQTSVDMNSFDQLERQLTSHMSEKNTLGDEISRLHQRGGKTLKERTRLKQAEARVGDLSKEIGMIRRTLATKPT